MGNIWSSLTGANSGSNSVKVTQVPEKRGAQQGVELNYVSGVTYFGVIELYGVELVFFRVK